MGSRHAKNASQYTDVAIYDNDPLKTEALSLDLNVTRFSNLSDAWKWSPDGVIIAIPNYLHVKFAIQSIDNNVKYVLIEKPIADKLDEAQTLVNAANKKGVSVFVVSNMRFNTAVQTIKKNLFKIGKPLFVTGHVGNYLPNMRPNTDYRKVYASNKKQGGGVLLDAIHEIDYMCWLFGGAKSIFANTDTLSNLEIDVEDFASIMIEHDTGVRTTLIMDYLQQCKRRGCEIVGSEGTLIWSSEGKAPEHCIVKIFEKSSNQWQLLLEDKSVDLAEPYQKLIREFVAAIEDKNHSLASIEEGCDALNVVISSHKSSEIGQRVSLSSRKING